MLRYLLGDHLGSTSLTVDTAGAEAAEIRYMPWGGARYTSGSTPTTFHYTGQREQSEIGLYFYNARWYDAALGRFAEADSLIPNPGDPASYDRYSYVRNNPLRYIDPSGNVTKPPTTQQCGPDNMYCGGLEDEDGPPTQLTLALTGKGQRLVQFAERGGYTILEVIQMGLAGEISSWYLDQEKVEIYRNAMGVRYQWYIRNFCGGVDSWICKVNFWTSYSQTVNTIVNNYWDNPGQARQDYMVPGVVQSRWDAAGRILNGITNPDPGWTDFDTKHPPHSLPNNWNLPFDVGIISLDVVLSRLHGEQPTQGTGENQFLVLERCVYEGEDAICVIMTVLQWKFWTGN